MARHALPGAGHLPMLRSAPKLCVPMIAVAEVRVEFPQPLAPRIVSC